MTSSTTSTQQFTREIPLNFNGYTSVAARATQMPAADVRAGDVLILDSYVSLVRRVDNLPLSGQLAGSHACWIQGDINILRFPHEIVSVLRP